MASRMRGVCKSVSDTPPYEEHGAADATSIHNARLTLSLLVYMVIYLADGDECDICGGCRTALMHIRCIPSR